MLGSMRVKAITFTSFVEMHKYIASQPEIKMNVDAYKTVHYVQQSGLELWAIHGLIDGYDNYIWTQGGWQDIDYYVELYEFYTWEARWNRDPVKVYRDRAQVVNFVIR